MEYRKLADTEFRYGKFGPGYMTRGPRTDFGVVQLRPGDEAENHYHSKIEETFVGLEGEATLWVDGRRSYTVRPGELYRMDPGEQHFFTNESGSVFRALFVKAPYDPQDGVKVPWHPGDPEPELAH